MILAIAASIFVTRFQGQSWRYSLVGLNRLASILRDSFLLNVRKLIIMARHNLIHFLLYNMKAQYPPGGLTPHLNTAAYDDFHYHEEPEDLFSDLENMRGQVLALLEAPLTAEQDARLDDYLTCTLARLFYGSSLIERAGSSLDITLQISQKIYLLYDDLKEDLLKKNLLATPFRVQKAYHEIAQHCHALTHILNAILKSGQPWDPNYGTKKKVAGQAAGTALAH